MIAHQSEGIFSKHILGTNVKGNERSRILIRTNWRVRLESDVASRKFDLGDFEIIDTSELQKIYHKLKLT